MKGKVKMKKLKSIFVMAIIMVFALTAMSSAQSNIVDSMDFQGTAVSISAADAGAMAQKDNADIMKYSLEIEKAKVTSLKYNDAVKGYRSLYSDSKSINYLQTVKTNEIMRDYTDANAKRNYDATVQKVKSEVQESYYSALQAQQAVQINNDNLKVVKEIFDITKKKFDLGLVAKQEVLNVELNLLKAEKDLKASEVMAKTAKMALNIKLGREVMAELGFKDELKFEEYKLGSIADAINKAIGNRNEVKTAEYAYQLQDINVQVEKGKNSSSSAATTASLNFDQAKKDLENANKSIELDVRANYLDITQKAEEVKSGQKSVELAAEALKIAQVSYEKGMTTLTDLQKAQVALQQAKLGLSKSILDYKLAILKYEDSTGVGRTVIANSSAAASN